MKIIHTADLHLGQVIYQNYDRTEEHRHFFSQLGKWCVNEQADVLLVCGDVFDIPQPSAATKKAFTDYFVQLHQLCPDMHIVITAGNHDSASRIEAEKSVWALANTHLVGVSPSVDAAEGWEDNYIIELPSGFIVAMPYVVGNRKEQFQALLDKVAERNHDGKPVVMMGHTAVTGMDAMGHGIEIGKIKTQDADCLGQGYDYLALGHIHKPQTIDHQEDCMKLDTVAYQSPVMRYSGSALHVSCDEQYPHTVSIVSIDSHGGDVSIRQLRIDELLHFYVLPEDGSFTSHKDALDAVKEFAETKGKGYIRLRIDYTTALPSNFNQMVYDALAPYGDNVRFNPKTLWTGQPDTDNNERQQVVFEVVELQQMKDPMEFIEKTQHLYPDIDIEELREAFKEIALALLEVKE